MRVMTVTSAASSEHFEEQELADPTPGPGEVLIAVAAAGVNRADIYQRKGHYSSPTGAPQWPGLEVSGTIEALGDGVTGLSIGDRVCALLGGGGYATKAIAVATHVLPVPENVDLIDAAALPEALATVWSNLVMTARLAAGETLLVHGGSSGIGTMAIQVARELGARVAVTASSQRKLDACRELGADILIDYPTQDFVTEINRATDGRGADVILDAIGGEYLERDLACLAPHGRIVFIGTQGGERHGTLDLSRLMARWGSVHGALLRARSDAEKTDIIAQVRDHAWPLVATARIRPVVDERFALTDVATAHAVMEASSHIGKLVLIA
ncbi:MAG TPA: NAD(P)H-quinone oxidoreductase [Terrimesophilobacter sp.]|nr:NAD(P)H-quinone oxidoreductase [Terrimesophilobacter sp.]